MYRYETVIQLSQSKVECTLFSFLSMIKKSYNDQRTTNMKHITFNHHNPRGTTPFMNGAKTNIYMQKSFGTSNRFH